MAANSAFHWKYRFVPKFSFSSLPISTFFHDVQEGSVKSGLAPKRIMAVAVVFSGISISIKKPDVKELIDFFKISELPTISITGETNSPAGT